MQEDKLDLWIAKIRIISFLKNLNKNQKVDLLFVVVKQVPSLLMLMKKINTQMHITLFSKIILFLRGKFTSQEPLFISLSLKMEMLQMLVLIMTSSKNIIIFIVINGKKEIQLFGIIIELYIKEWADSEILKDYFKNLMQSKS